MIHGHPSPQHRHRHVTTHAINYEPLIRSSDIYTSPFDNDNNDYDNNDT
jgi:hypothetical protein